MSIAITHLRTEVIRPCLRLLDLWSPTAEDLLVGTAVQESHCGSYLRQMGGGPALGIYQMEPATHDDIWAHFLAYRPRLATEVRRFLAPGVAAHEQLPWNLYYATAMARMHYLRRPERLPAYGDVRGYAAYWKAHYNTPLGKGTEAEFVANWARFRAADGAPAAAA